MFAAPTPTLPHRGREYIGVFLFFSSLHEDAKQACFIYITWGYSASRVWMMWPAIRMPNSAGI